jgi:hypothetical protein
MKSFLLSFRKAAHLRSVIVLVCFSLCGLPGFSQPGISGRNIIAGAGFGYNFPFSGGNLGVNQTSAGIEGVYGSWAQGLAAGLDLGIETCDRLYAMFSLNYLHGREVEFTTVFENPNSSYHHSTVSRLAIPVVLTAGGRYYPDPSCCLLNRLGIGGGERFGPYIGIGAGLALGARMRSIQTTESLQPDFQYITEVISTTAFKPSLIATAELGMTYKVSESLKVYGGLDGTSISLLNSHRRITTFLENGIDRTDEIPVEGLETVFVKELEFQENQDPDEPSRELAEKHPASGISFNVGVLYNIAPRAKKPTIPPAGKGIGREPSKPKAPPAGKVQAAAAGANCKNCPPIQLMVTSNNDPEIYAEDNIEIVTSGPWGSAELRNLTMENYITICDTCLGSQGACCCQLVSLIVRLNFKMSLNLKKIEKGVWMNTNKEDKKGFGRTIVAKELPKGTPNPQDWKKVDRQSVEVHERQHFVDMKEAISANLGEALKQFEVIQYPCSPPPGEFCKKRVEEYLRGIGGRIQALANAKAKEIAAAENSEYMSGELEIKARTKQAEDLNSRR